MCWKSTLWSSPPPPPSDFQGMLRHCMEWHTHNYIDTLNLIMCACFFFFFLLLFFLTVYNTLLLFNHTAIGVITPNQIPLTTIVTYLQKGYRSRISNHWATSDYTCMQCGTSHLQKVQENILSHIILATYRKFTVATVRFTQNVSCNIFTHPIYQQVANVTV